MKRFFYPREWFFIAIQFLSVLAFMWAVAAGSTLNNWLLSFFGYFLITCLGITVTFHRLLTHKSYTLWKPLEYLFSFFGNMGCTGSSVGWVFVHKEHHKHADVQGDPHSPVIYGAWGAFVGDYGGKFNKWSVKEIINDPVHRFMHEYYILIVLAVGSILSLISVTLLVHLFLIPIFFNTMASRLSNWIDHDPRFGKKDNITNDQSHNVWWWALLTFGEGWHNNHHRYPGDWKIGKTWWQFDPGRYVIQILMWSRLASERKISYN